MRDVTVRDDDPVKLPETRPGVGGRAVLCATAADCARPASPAATPTGWGRTAPRRPPSAGQEEREGAEHAARPRCQEARQGAEGPG